MAKRKQAKLLVVRIDFRMFDVCEAWCVVGPWPVARKAIIHRWKWPTHELPSEGACKHRGWFFSDNVGQRAIIWLPCPPTTAGDLATLAHEAVHLMVRMMDWIGIKVDTNSDEVVAHGVSFIMRTVINAVPLPRK